MPLLNEGTDVYRPVYSNLITDNIYQVETSVEGLSPEQLDEEWSFPIGSVVRCKKFKDNDETYLRIIQLANL